MQSYNTQPQTQNAQDYITLAIYLQSVETIMKIAERENYLISKGEIVNRPPNIDNLINQNALVYNYLNSKFTFTLDINGELLVNNMKFKLTFEQIIKKFSEYKPSRLTSVLL